MKLSLAQLPSSLARGLAPLYVVAGEEPLLVEESLDAIRAKARAEGYSEREVLDVERGFDGSRLVEACAALSLFASRRLIEVRMPTGNPGADGAKALEHFAARPAPDVLLLVICAALDFRQRSASWYAALESAGASVYAAPIEAGAFPGWLAERLRASGLSADPEAVAMLAGRTEGNALAASQDIEKLRLLYPDGRIDADRVREAVADSARFGTFDLVDRMLAGDGPGVLRSVAGLRESGVEVLEILGALLWGLRQWAQAQAAFTASRDAAAACQQAQVPRARQPAMRRALARTRLPHIYGWLRRAAAIDHLAKSTGGKEQAWEELLTLLVAASGHAAGTIWERGPRTGLAGA